MLFATSSKRLATIAVAIGLIASACAGEATNGGADTPILLTEQGIGNLEIGDSFDSVSNALVLLFGGPDVDSDDPTSRVYVPECGGQTNRLQAWGNFIVMYTGSDDDLRFASWTYGFDPLTGSGDDIRNLGLTTDQGIGLGSTRSDIEAAYGSSASFTDAPELDSVLVDIGNTASSHITGRLGPDVVLLELAPTCE